MRPPCSSLLTLAAVALMASMPVHADYFEDAERALELVTEDKYDDAEWLLNSLYAEVTAEQAYVVAHFLENGERPETTFDPDFTPDSVMGLIEGYRRHMNKIASSPDRTKLVAGAVVRFYEKSAGAGNIEAMRGLADLYKGKGPLQSLDNEKRRQWLKRAADAGSELSARELEELEERMVRLASGDQDLLYQDAEELLYSNDQKAVQEGIGRMDELAKSGYIPAMVFLGTQYSKFRRGDTADHFAKALEYFNECAALGDEECEFWVEDIQVCIDTGERCDSL